MTPEIGSSEIDLVKSADALLYEAKGEGRDRAIIVDRASGARDVLDLGE